MPSCLTKDDVVILRRNVKKRQTRPVARVSRMNTAGTNPQGVISPPSWLSALLTSWPLSIRMVLLYYLCSAVQPPQALFSSSSRSSTQPSPSCDFWRGWPIHQSPTRIPVNVRAITPYTQNQGERISSPSLGLQLKNVIEKIPYSDTMHVR